MLPSANFTLMLSKWRIVLLAKCVAFFFGFFIGMLFWLLLRGTCSIHNIMNVSVRFPYLRRNNGKPKVHYVMDQLGISTNEEWKYQCLPSPEFTVEEQKRVCEVEWDHWEYFMFEVNWGDVAHCWIADNTLVGNKVACTEEMRIPV